MRAGGEVDGISRCADEVDSHFVSLVRRLEEDKSLLKDQEKAAEAAAALRNALQARLSHHANNGTGKDQRDEMSKKRDAIASSFLNASPSLNILDLFDAYAKGRQCCCNHSFTIVVNAEAHHDADTFY